MENRNYIQGIPDSKIGELSEELQIENKSLIFDHLIKSFEGSGHYKVSLDVTERKNYETITLSRTITDMSIVDEWNYDEEDFKSPSAWYDSEEQLFCHVFDLIMTDDNKQKLVEWVKTI